MIFHVVRDDEDVGLVLRCVEQLIVIRQCCLRVVLFISECKQYLEVCNFTSFGYFSFFQGRNTLLCMVIWVMLWYIFGIVGHKCWTKWFYIRAYHDT